MDLTEVVQTYGSAWNEPLDDLRRGLLESSWADDAVYCDPTGTAEGREAFVAHIAGFQAMMPGHRIELTTAVDEHDGHLRFGWTMFGPAGEIVTEGMDYGTLAVDGRLQRIVGFFGPLTPVGA